MDDPQLARVQLATYATAWVVERPNLRPKTRQLYEGLVRLHIEPTLGRYTLAQMTPARGRTWRSNRLASGVGAVTVAKAYRLLRTIMATAVEDRLIRHNPCQIKGAGTESIPERPILTVAQVYAVADAMPGRYRLLVLLATFCSLRWGELAALRAGSLDVERGLVHVRESLSEMGDGSLVIGPPKTLAGRRAVAIPAGLLPEVARHLATYASGPPDALVFAGPKGAPPRRSNFQKFWRAALDAAGLPSSVHFHDLRHTGNTPPKCGATLTDLMARAGQSSTRAARIYLHTTSDRDRQVAPRWIVSCRHRRLVAPKSDSPSVSLRGTRSWEHQVSAGGGLRAQQPSSRCPAASNHRARSLASRSSTDPTGDHLGDPSPTRAPLLRPTVSLSDLTAVMQTPRPPHSMGCCQVGTGIPSECYLRRLSGSRAPYMHEGITEPMLDTRLAPPG